ncbi:MAG: cystathionine gamma-lyase [Micropepsaceae bacterium]
MTQPDNDKLAAELLHHFGRNLQPGDSVTPAIVPTAVFYLPGNPSNAPYQYGRFHNPTWDALESALSMLESAETVLFPSGMAAIASVLYSQLKSGDRVLLPSDGYYTTRVLVEKYLQPLGVHFETRSTTRFMDGGFQGFRLVFIETPSNPGLDVCDISMVAAQTRATGALLVADNTTMTPLGQRPLDLGADVVVNADTKAINGHSDVLFGHVASRNGLLCQSLRDWRRFSGSVPGPFEAWQVFRGLETLEVRYSRMCATAQLLAERLAEHAATLNVRYPGLPADPGHSIASRQMSCFGSMITLTLKDGPTAERFIRECKLVQPSTSFGGVRTCAERRERWGDAVDPGFIRLSIGIEPSEVLWQAMAETLEKLG